MSMARTPHQEFTESVLVGEVAVFRLLRPHPFPTVIELVRDAIAQAYEQRQFKLMVVVTALTGPKVPSLALRSSMTREWAGAARGLVCVAMVCRPEFIDPHRFGVTMATNFGMRANVFETEAAASEWLLQLT